MKKSLSIELKGLGHSMLVSLILCLLSATVVYYSSLRETVIPWLGNIIIIISVFWGSCYVSKSYGSKGLVRGISMGILFFILMLIATLAFNSQLVDFKGFMKMLLLCIVSGALGGIVGIGLSGKAL